MYTTISKSQEAQRKPTIVRKILSPKPRDDLAELFSDEEEQRKQKEILKLDPLPPKNCN